MSFVCPLRISTVLRQHAQLEMQSDVFSAYMILSDTFYVRRAHVELHFLPDAPSVRSHSNQCFAKLRSFSSAVKRARLS